MYEIKVIIKKPGEKYGKISTIKNDLKALQEMVGGYIEAIYGENYALICDEEGKLKRYAPNMRYRGSLLVGTIIVAGIENEEFSDVPLSLDEWEKIVDAQ